MGRGGKGELLFNEYGITNVQEETFLEKCFKCEYIYKYILYVFIYMYIYTYVYMYI